MAGIRSKHGKKHEMCPVCKAAGKESKLQLFQINLDEATKMCSHPKVKFIMNMQTWHIHGLTHRHLSQSCYRHFCYNT